MPPFSEPPLLVVFTSFNRYTAQIDRLEDAEAARVMDAYYELAGSLIGAGGGRVVKFIGDATFVRRSRSWRPSPARCQGS